MAGPSEETTPEDVVEAFRWILGRELEDDEVAARFAVSHPLRRQLRAGLLRSAEFQAQFRSEHFVHRLPEQWLDPTEPRLVFLHVPKTGGTTLHHLLAGAVGSERVAKERHNRLYSHPLGDIASVKLFSGHYDRRTIQLLPWGCIRVATLLREPRDRLISLYRYLRAHSESLVARDGLALALAARRFGFGDFLRAAIEINRASVDNTYLRALGASLPHRRWEQRAEPGAAPPLEQFGMALPDLRWRAATFLEGCAAVGQLEQFDLSLRKIFKAFDLPAPEDYTIRQRLDDLIATNGEFEPVAPVATTLAEDALIEELTQYDRELYALAGRLLAVSS